MVRLCQTLARAVQNTLKVIADNLVFFSQRTGLHGVKYIGNRSMKAWERWFFLVYFILILTYVAILISNIWAKWGRTPVIVAMNPHPIDIFTLPFPTITICNVNQIGRIRAEQLPNASVEYSIVKAMCSEDIEGGDPRVVAEVKNRTFFQKFVKDAAQPCSRMMISCKYGKNDMNCEEIFRTILTDEGLCCTFNALHLSFVYNQRVPFAGLIEKDGTTGVNWDLEDGYPKKLPMAFYPRPGSGTGVSLGLSVIIDAEVDDYTCTTTNGAGFKVLLSNPIEIPILRENGLFVQTGTETSFRIRAERTESTQNIRSFSIKDRQCVFGSERTLGFFKSYTKANCELECLMNITAKLCGCTSFFVPDSWSSAPACTVKDDPCQEPILNWEDVSPMQQTCKDFCMQECFDLDFSPTRFAIPLSTGNYMMRDAELEQYNASYRTKNIAVVHFYYESSYFTGYMRTRYIGPTEFISNAGGLIGFLGFSFITVAEFSYFTILKSLLSFVRWLWGKIRGKQELESRQGMHKGELTPGDPKKPLHPRFGRAAPVDWRFKATRRISHRL